MGDLVEAGQSALPAQDTQAALCGAIAELLADAALGNVEMDPAEWVAKSRGFLRLLFGGQGVNNFDMVLADCRRQARGERRTLLSVLIERVPTEELPTIQTPAQLLRTCMLAPAFAREMMTKPASDGRIGPVMRRRLAMELERVQ